MGITKSKCVSLEDEVAYHTETYTVIRSSGEEQTGWMISPQPHRCRHYGQIKWNPTCYATLERDGWRIHMHNGHEDPENPKAHACGWRPLHEIWPTRLTGDKEAIEVWRTGLKEIIVRLAKQKGLPTEWHDHTCHQVHHDYCSGCHWEKKAKDQAAGVKPDPLEEALAELGAKPYHPVYNPMGSA
jgi:hypothetical protein